MRWSKGLTSLLLAFSLSISAVSLGWSVINDNSSSIVLYALHVAFNLYLFIISVRSTYQDTLEYHSESIIHISILLTIAFVLLGIASILPSEPSPIISTFQDIRVLEILQLVNVGIYGIAWILSVTTPMGPPMHYSPSNIYSEKTVQAITNMDENNVCGIINSSPWDFMLFSYTTKVVWLGNIAASLDIGDLPIVPANIRATFNYARMRKATREIQLRIFSWTPKRGSGFLLAYRLIRLNSIVFLAELLLAAVSAVLFYGPPFFLQKLVKYLEVDPTREQKGWGWVYVFGIFFANVASFMSVLFACIVYYLLTVLQSLVSCGH